MTSPGSGEGRTPGPDDFRGDNAHLRRCIEALLALDASGSLVPHGVGGHARGLLTAAYHRLEEKDMRWKAKKNGWRKRFAWLPTKIGDEWIWWEPYESWFMGEFTLVRLPEEATGKDTP